MRTAITIYGDYGAVLLPFVSRMARELIDNSYKGSPEYWRELPMESILCELNEHTAKLSSSIRTPRPDMEKLKEYAADVANLALILTEIAKAVHEDLEENSDPQCMGGYAQIGPEDDKVTMFAGSTYSFSDVHAVKCSCGDRGCSSGNLYPYTSTQGCMSMEEAKELASALHELDARRLLDAPPINKNQITGTYTLCQMGDDTVVLELMKAGKGYSMCMSKPGTEVASEFGTVFDGVGLLTAEATISQDAYYSFSEAYRVLSAE